MGSIGFTGPRDGMTRRQVETLVGMLAGVPPRYRTLRQGGCIGSDATAAGVARDLGFRNVEHPPTNPRLRAWFPVDLRLSPMPYLVRNEVIVDRSSVLFATPTTKTRPRGSRSGTWFTINYAWRTGVVAYLIIPDGSVIIRDPRRATVGV